MGAQVEYRPFGQDGMCVVVDGHTALICESVVQADSVIRPGTGTSVNVAIVTRRVRGRELFSSLVVDGCIPPRDDWFPGRFQGLPQPGEEGISILSERNGFVQFPWP